MKSLKILALLSLILCFSCTTENATTDSIQNTIETADLSKANKPKKVLKIEVPLGRPKHECTGFGICAWPTISIGCVDAEGNSIPCDTAQVSPAGNTTATTTVFYTDQIGYYFDLAFDTPVREYEREDLNLVVEENYTLETEEIIGHGLTIKKAHYKYNSTIGKHGGVRVPLAY